MDSDSSSSRGLSDRPSSACGTASVQGDKERATVCVSSPRRGAKEGGLPTRAHQGAGVLLCSPGGASHGVGPSTQTR